MKSKKSFNLKKGLLVFMISTLQFNNAFAIAEPLNLKDIEDNTISLEDVLVDQVFGNIDLELYKRMSKEVEDKVLSNEDFNKLSKAEQIEAINKELAAVSDLRTKIQEDQASIKRAASNNV